MSYHGDASSEVAAALAEEEAAKAQRLDQQKRELEEAKATAQAFLKSWQGKVEGKTKAWQMAVDAMSGATATVHTVDRATDHEVKAEEVEKRFQEERSGTRDSIAGKVITERQGEYDEGQPTGVLRKDKSAVMPALVRGERAAWEGIDATFAEMDKTLRSELDPRARDFIIKEYGRDGAEAAAAVTAPRAEKVKEDPLLDIKTIYSNWTLERSQAEEEQAMDEFGKGPEIEKAKKADQAMFAEAKASVPRLLKTIPQYDDLIQGKGTIKSFPWDEQRWGAGSWEILQGMQEKARRIFQMADLAQTPEGEKEHAHHVSFEKLREYAGLFTRYCQQLQTKMDINQPGSTNELLKAAIELHLYEAKQTLASLQQFLEAQETNLDSPLKREKIAGKDKNLNQFERTVSDLKEDIDRFESDQKILYETKTGQKPQFTMHGSRNEAEFQIMMHDMIARGYNLDVRDEQLVAELKKFGITLTFDSKYSDSFRIDGDKALSSFLKPTHTAEAWQKFSQERQEKLWSTGLPSDLISAQEETAIRSEKGSGADEEIEKLRVERYNKLLLYHGGMQEGAREQVEREVKEAAAMAEEERKRVSDQKLIEQFHTDWDVKIGALHNIRADLRRLEAERESKYSATSELINKLNEKFKALDVNVELLVTKEYSQENLGHQNSRWRKLLAEIDTKFDADRGTLGFTEKPKYKNARKLVEEEQVGIQQSLEEVLKYHEGTVLPKWKEWDNLFIDIKEIYNKMNNQLKVSKITSFEDFIKETE
ncbi:MAG: hypothetical protein WC659_06810 [Patescibacteria group bacterium]